MKVHPAFTCRGQLDSRGAPVGLDLVADAVEDIDGVIDWDISDVNGQVKIAMYPRLATEESIDAPSSGHPGSLTGGVESREHSKNLRRC